VDTFRNSATGVPTGIPQGDVDGDGKVDGTAGKADYVKTNAAVGGGSGAYKVELDVNLDGLVTAADVTIVTAKDRIKSGRGKMSAASVGWRVGWAQLEWIQPVCSYSGVGNVYRAEIAMLTGVLSVGYAEYFDRTTYDGTPEQAVRADGLATCTFASREECRVVGHRSFSPMPGSVQLDGCEGAKCCAHLDWKCTTITIMTCVRDGITTIERAMGPELEYTKITLECGLLVRDGGPGCTCTCLIWNDFVYRACINFPWYIFPNQPRQGNPGRRVR